MTDYYSKIDTNNILDTNLDNKVKGPKARVNNEIIHLFNQCDYVSSNRNSNNTISLTVRRGKKKYELDFPKDYPFKIPTNVCYNGHDYKKSLFTSSEKIKNILKNIYHIDCLCCHTILCSEWGPMNNVSQIINEMDKMTQFKKEIRIRLNCDMVRDKFRCYFAEFEKYLFSTFFTKL